MYDSSLVVLVRAATVAKPSVYGEVGINAGADVVPGRVDIRHLAGRHQVNLLCSVLLLSGFVWRLLSAS